MASYSLAALMGALSGTPGLEAGMEASDKQRLAEQTLAETQRHRQMLESGMNTNVDTLYKTLGITPPAGVDPNATMPTSWGPHAMTALEAQRKNEANARMDEALATSLLRKGTRVQPGDLGGEGGSRPYSDVGQTQTIVDPGMRFLADTVLGIGHEKATPIITKHMELEAEANNPKVTAHQVQGPNDTFTYGVDRSANVVNPPKPLGIGAPQNRGPFTREDIEALLTERGWSKEMPGYREAYANVARQIPVSGVGAFGAGQFVVPPPPSGATPKPAVSPKEGLPAAPLVGAQQPLPGAQTSELADLRSLQQQLKDVSARLKPGYIGPIAGGIGGYLREKTGVGMDKDEAQFRASLQTFWNILGQVRSGKVLTANEMSRLDAELPSASAPPDVFAAKMANSAAYLDRLLVNKEREYAARQYRGGSPVPMPTGVVKWGRDVQGRPVRLE